MKSQDEIKEEISQLGDAVDKQMEAYMLTITDWVIDTKQKLNLSDEAMSAMIRTAPSAQTAFMTGMLIKKLRGQLA